MLAPYSTANDKGLASHSHSGLRFWISAFRQILHPPFETKLLEDATQLRLHCISMCGHFHELIKLCKQSNTIFISHVALLICYNVHGKCRIVIYMNNQAWCQHMCSSAGIHFHTSCFQMWVLGCSKSRQEIHFNAILYHKRKKRLCWLIRAHTQIKKTPWNVFLNQANRSTSRMCGNNDELWAQQLEWRKSGL